MGKSGGKHIEVRRTISVTTGGVVLWFRADVRQEAAYPSRSIRAAPLVACKGEECIDILEPDMLFQEVYR